MAKTPEKSAAPAPQPTEFAQSLDEFCRQASVNEPRYGLIAMFHFQEKTAGRVKDFPSAYAKRFADYVNPQAI
ncbi:hypothetical protein GJ904_17815 [Salmonella enterica]|nr:hypothetical protein [Salmonella enterica subsp. enterica serovar Saintpaul]EEC1302930.1 hypothetical protein [Salmonella enterica]